MKKYIAVLVVIILFLFAHSASAAPYAYVPSVYGSDVTVFDTGTYATVGSPIPVGTWPNTSSGDFAGAQLNSCDTLGLV